MSKLLATLEGLVPVSQIFEVPFQNINVEQGPPRFKKDQHDFLCTCFFSFFP